MSGSVRPHGLQPTRLLRPWDSPGKNTGVGCHFLLLKYLYDDTNNQQIYRKQWIKLVSSSHSFVFIVVIQLLSHVRLFATPLTELHHASLSFTVSYRLLKLMSIELVMPSNHPVLYCPIFFLPSIFPSTRVFSSELALPIRWPKIGTSASATILPMNIQGWFLLGLTGLISLLSKGLSRFCS